MSSEVNWNLAGWQRKTIRDAKTNGSQRNEAAGTDPLQQAGLPVALGKMTYCGVLQNEGMIMRLAN